MLIELDMRYTGSSVNPGNLQIVFSNTAEDV